jgi:hypothetical protein
MAIDPSPEEIAEVENAVAQRRISRPMGRLHDAACAAMANFCSNASAVPIWFDARLRIGSSSQPEDCEPLSICLSGSILMDTDRRKRILEESARLEKLMADVGAGMEVPCDKCKLPLAFFGPKSGRHPGIFCPTGCTEILMEFKR